MSFCDKCRRDCQTCDFHDKCYVCDDCGYRFVLMAAIEPICFNCKSKNLKEITEAEQVEALEMNPAAFRLPYKKEAVN